LSYFSMSSLLQGNPSGARVHASTGVVGLLVRDDDEKRLRLPNLLPSHISPDNPPSTGMGLENDRVFRNGILCARSFFLTLALIGTVRAALLRPPQFSFNSALGMTIQGVPFVQLLGSLVIASFLSLAESLQTTKPVPDRRADLFWTSLGIVTGLVFLLGMASAFR